MKKIYLIGFLLFVSVWAFSGPVELYYNGNLVKTFYHEKAIGYSDVQITSEQRPNDLFIMVDEEFNRTSSNAWGTRFGRKFVVTHGENGFGLAYYLGGYSNGFFEALTVHFFNLDDHTAVLWFRNGEADVFSIIIRDTLKIWGTSADTKP